MPRLHILIAASISFFFWGCSSSDQSPVSEPPDSTVAESNVSPDTTTSLASTEPWVEVSTSTGRPVISVLPRDERPNRLVTRDIAIGTGTQAGVGDVLEVNYVGALLSDGTEFDASWNRSQTFFVPIGMGAVIPGWDQGIVGMREGGRRVLITPPDLAYGSSGAGSSIPPDATLVFVVDLVAVLDLQPPAIPEPTEVGASLEVEDLVAGTGDPVESGDTVTVHYLGTLTDGTVFDASWRRGMPFTTTIGVGMVIPGWDQGIVGMREGGRRLLKIPSDLAYGERGSGAAIPPDTPLLFVVDLIRIQS
ncbi:MAG: FKBP-type peptidyl-prolyl cis-trans isomerase [Acidimicrobiales bacterium]|nr:FKBP-type peptidyl-prolyl cis-trans isomerase [Acidimicrobiales bacterium]